MENKSKREILAKTYYISTKNQINPKVFSLVNDNSHLGSKNIYSLENIITNKNLDKHTSTSTKEWTTSVYYYNKNYTKNLPIAINVIKPLLTSYFNLKYFSCNKKTKVSFENKYSLNKTLVSKSEVKITNDKVNITIYTYNRNKETLFIRFKDLINLSLLNKSLLTNNKLLLANKENLNSLKQSNFPNKRNQMMLLRHYYYYMNNVKNRLNNNFKKVKLNLNIMNIKEKNIKNSVQHLYEKLGSNIIKLSFLDYLNAFYIKKMLFLYYIRKVILNNNKYKNWFLLNLKKIISNIYNKKVELNIVNQKYFYLNSDIFIKAIAIRVKDRNNRVLSEMKNALAKISLAKLISKKSASSDILKKDFYLNKLTNTLKANIFTSIRYKHIQGVRIEAAGRLTQRLTAARSLSKVRLRGNLKNALQTDLSKNFSLNRGYAKPNVDYTILNAKTRNGAFGLKGWINSN